MGLRDFCSTFPWVHAPPFSTELEQLVGPAADKLFATLHILSQRRKAAFFGRTTICASFSILDNLSRRGLLVRLQLSLPPPYSCQVE